MICAEYDSCEVEKVPVEVTWTVSWRRGRPIVAYEAFGMEGLCLAEIF